MLEKAKDKEGFFSRFLNKWQQNVYDAALKASLGALENDPSFKQRQSDMDDEEEKLWKKYPDRMKAAYERTGDPVPERFKKYLR